eukprot:2858537-Pyramimonas_sp.AAC.1
MHQATLRAVLDHQGPSWEPLGANPVGFVAIPPSLPHGPQSGPVARDAPERLASGAARSSAHWGE